MQTTTTPTATQEVLKTLAKFIDGTPQVHTFETVISTLHHVAVAV